MKSVHLTDSLKASLVEQLSHIGLYQKLTGPGLEKIVSVCELVRYEPGELILKQGSPSTFFILILEGEIAIYSEREKGKRVHLIDLPPLTTVGELGLILEKPRTATAQAKDNCLAMRFSKSSFFSMFKNIPDFGFTITRYLAQRLEDVTGQVPLPVYEEEEKPADQELDKILPIAFQEKYRVVPISLKGNQLTVGFAEDPISPAMNAIYQILPGLSVRPMRIKTAQFHSLIRAKTRK